MTLEGTPLIVSPGGIADVGSSTKPPRSTRSFRCSRRRASRRSSSSSTRAAPSASGNGGGQRGSHQPLRRRDRARCPPIVPADGRRDRCRHHRPHELGGQLPHRRQGRDRGGVSGPRSSPTSTRTSTKATGDFVPGSILVNNRIVTQNVPEAAAMTALIAEYNEVVGTDRQRGRRPCRRRRWTGTSAHRGRESTLGRLIADAQLASPATIAVVAFMNPGGIRANLDGVGDPWRGIRGPAVQQHRHDSRSMTGAQIEIVLEQQFTVNSLATRSRRLHARSPTVLCSRCRPASPTPGRDGSRGQPCRSATMQLNNVTIDSDGYVSRDREQLHRDRRG